MKTNKKILIAISLCLMGWCAPGWSDANSPAPISITIEKQGTEMKHEVPQQDQDAFITSQVRVAFRNVPGFAEDKVMIKTDKGIVTLTGNVVDENIKNNLEKSAKGINGVKAVKNELKIEKK